MRSLDVVVPCLSALGISHLAKFLARIEVGRWQLRAKLFTLLDCHALGGCMFRIFIGFVCVLIACMGAAPLSASQKVIAAKKKTKRLEVSAVPTMLVNGKGRLDLRVGGTTLILQRVEQLIDTERTLRMRSLILDSDGYSRGTSDGWGTGISPTSY